MTTTPHAELLPCPFCGGTKLESEHTESYVFCRGCRASGPYTSKQGRAASIESWNERALLARLGEQQPVKWAVGLPGESIKIAAVWDAEPTAYELRRAPLVVTPLYAHPPAAQPAFNPLPPQKPLDADMAQILADDGWDLYARDGAAAQPVAQGEREAFEAFMRRDSTLPLDRDATDEYASFEVALMWHSWQGRAAQKANAPGGALVGESGANARLDLAGADSACDHDFALQPSSSMHICLKCGRSNVAARSAAQGAAQVPAGWKLVPVKPTEAMVDAFENAMEGANSYVRNFPAAYAAMLSAAPSPAGERTSTDGEQQ